MTPHNLTKREWFAGQALQGYLASGGTAWSGPEDEAELAKRTCAHADATLAELERTAPKAERNDTLTLPWAEIEEAIVCNLQTWGGTRLDLQDVRRALGFTEPEEPTP